MAFVKWCLATTSFTLTKAATLIRRPLTPTIRFLSSTFACFRSTLCGVGATGGGGVQVRAFWARCGGAARERHTYAEAAIRLSTGRTTAGAFYGQAGLASQASGFHNHCCRDCKRGLEQPHDLYEIALRNCMERTYDFLKNRGERKRTTHIIIEGRGSKEDRQLTEAFRRIRHGENSPGQTLPGLDIVFADKKANLAGLQISDLTARPMGRHCINPEQSNRAWDAIEPKLLRSPQGDVDGWGLSLLPK